MAYVFTRDLETGNAKIDSQHKELFDAMNKLEAACSQGKGRVEVEKTLQFLSDYITKHFGDEETLQRQSGYPEFMKHKGYHETFKKVVADIAAEYKRDGSSIVLVGKVNAKVGMWLLNHINREDVKLGQYLKSKNM